MMDGETRIKVYIGKYAEIARDLSKGVYRRKTFIYDIDLFAKSVCLTNIDDEAWEPEELQWIVSELEGNWLGKTVVKDKYELSEIPGMTKAIKVEPQLYMKLVYIAFEENHSELELIKKFMDMKYEGKAEMALKRDEIQDLGNWLAGSPREKLLGLLKNFDASDSSKELLVRDFRNGKCYLKTQTRRIQQESQFFHHVLFMGEENAKR